MQHMHLVLYRTLADFKIHVEALKKYRIENMNFNEYNIHEHNSTLKRNKPLTSSYVYLI